MPTVPANYFTTAIESRQSNYLGNYSAVRDKTRFIVTGSTIKRANWRKLPYPQRSTPLAYFRHWDKLNHTWLRNNYTENGPSGAYNYLFENYISYIDPWSARDTSVVTSADYKAVAKLLNTLKGEGANIANMFAERRQTANLVVNTLKTFTFAIRDLRRGNITSAIRRMGGDPSTARKLRGKDISQQWLSLQYGWKPLMSDIYSLVNGLHVRESTGVTVFKASSGNFSVKKSPTMFSSYQGQRSAGLVRTTADVKYMVRVKPNLKLASPAALGLTNPLVPLWEIVPWSFVVDWFLPIGNYLEQLSADHGWDFYDGCKTTLTKVSEVLSDQSTTFRNTGAWTYRGANSIRGDGTSVEMVRTLLSAIPSPNLPQFKNPFSAAHVLNAIALLHQVVKR